MRRLVCALLCALLLALLPACARTAEPEAQSLWYLRATPDGLRWETRGFTPVSADAAEQCREVLAALHDPPEGLTAALPGEVALQSLRVSGNVVYVDFSAEYAALGDAARSAACAATVHSLLALPGLFYVSVTADGTPLAPTYERYCTRGTFVLE